MIPTRANLPYNLLFVEAIVDKQVDIVKRYCQSTVDMNPERPD